MGKGKVVTLRAVQLHYDEDARSIFVALHRMAGQGSNPWAGAITFTAGKAWTTDQSGETFAAVDWLDDGVSLEGVTIPASVVRELATKRWVGCQFTLEGEKVELFANREYHFTRAIRQLGPKPVTAGDATITLERPDELIDVLPESGTVLIRHSASDGVSVGGKVCRTAHVAEGKPRGTVDAALLHRVLGLVQGHVTLGFYDGALRSVLCGDVTVGLADSARYCRPREGGYEVPQATLHAALEAVKLPGREMGLPALNGVLISTGPQPLPPSRFDPERRARVTVEATDLERWGLAFVDAHVEQTTPYALVNAAMLRDVVSRMSGRIHLALDGGQLRLRCGGREVKLRLLDTKDFPSALEFPYKAPSWGMYDGEHLATEVAAVAAFSSRDEARPILTGMLVETIEQGLRLVATDSYRLATTVVACQEAPSEVGVTRVVPARVLQQMTERGRDYGSVELFSGSSVFAVKVGAIGGERWTSRLIEGDYPNWSQLFPGPVGSTLTVRAASLDGAVVGLAPLARGQVPVRFEGTRLLTGAQDIGEAFEELDGRWDTDPVAFAVNPAYLRDAISFAGSPEVSLRVQTGLKPIVVEGGLPNRRALLMPVRV